MDDQAIVWKKEDPVDGSPTVSIGIPVYNGENFIGHALDDLLAQTFQDFELIISDNASTDATPKICASYLKRDNRVKYFRNERNRGGPANFTRVLDLATGRYFMWAACDDRWLPEFVSTLLDELETHPDAGLAMSAMHRHRAEGSYIDSILFSGDEDPNRMSYLQLFMEMAKRNRYHYLIYGLYHTDFLKKAWANPLPTVPSHDRLFMCQIALATQIRYVGQFLHVRTIHDMPIELRYPEEEVSRLVDENRFAFCQTWLSIEPYLWASKVIPSHRKYLIRIAADVYAEAFAKALVKDKRNASIAGSSELPTKVLEEMEVIKELRSLGRLQEAHMLVTTLFADAPDSPELLNLASEIKYQMGYRDAAKKVLLDLVKYWPTHSQALNNLAVIFWDEKNQTEAFLYARKAVDAGPDNVNARLNLADMLVQSGDVNGGKACLESALERAPQNVEALRCMAIIHVQHGDTQRAYEHLMLAKKEAPEDEEINDLLSKIQQTEAPATG